MFLLLTNGDVAIFFLTNDDVAICFVFPTNDDVAIFSFFLINDESPYVFNSLDTVFLLKEPRNKRRYELFFMFLIILIVLT